MVDVHACAKLRETIECAFSLVTVICDAQRDATPMHRVNARCPGATLELSFDASFLVSLLIIATWLTPFRNNALNYSNFVTMWH